jgi:hypothetical protein
LRKKTHIDHLVTDNPALAFSAYDRGCLAKLAAVLRDITPIAPRAEWEEEEEEDGVAGLREVRLSSHCPTLLHLLIASCAGFL